MSILVVGLQFGDEGKGRISGYMAKDMTHSVRFNGGPNAGHTVYDNKGECFKLHHLPCGIVHNNIAVLDAGMVVDINKLADELQYVKDKGLNPTVLISENVHIITEKHILNDSKNDTIGTTRSGIGYVYADRALRAGFRAHDFKQELEALGICLYKGRCPDLGDDSGTLLEGAQGIMLDIDYGEYPFVTSSSIMPSHVHKVDVTVGVMKAYTSRVGQGPPYHQDEEELRNIGQEFGVTTGRPRRCSWLDLDQIDYALGIVRPNVIALTKIDILNDMDIYVYEHGKKRLIGNVDTYLDFLCSRFPQIELVSDSPQGEMIYIGE